MRLSAFPLLADENVDPDVVEFLRTEGVDVLSVRETHLRGCPDSDLLRAAVREGRAVLTHDPDFGTLAIVGGEPIIGIVYLCPGHIQSQYTIASLNALFDIDPEVTPPFLVIVRRNADRITVRIRAL